MGRAGARGRGSGQPRGGGPGDGTWPFTNSALSFLPPSNLTSSWEHPALWETRDPQAPLGRLACPDPQATRATKAPRGSLGGRGSRDPPARRGLWDHPVSLELKDLRGLQAWLGQMERRGHQGSQGHKVPPGCLGTKDLLVPQDLHRSLANQGSEGSRDSLD